jgi:hypothetical protein
MLHKNCFMAELAADHSDSEYFFRGLPNAELPE